MARDQRTKMRNNIKSNSRIQLCSGSDRDLTKQARIWTQKKEYLDIMSTRECYKDFASELQISDQISGQECGRKQLWPIVSKNFIYN
uniref:Uncharacterized protein n=1 Tax=Arundo donax TaxID=35708 RepID=A0A0A9EFQ9_ARUDO